MNVMSIIHRPESVVPDITIESATPQQLIDAVNIRISKYTAAQGRNVSIRTITGNKKISNPSITNALNRTVGACVDVVGNRIFFANYDSSLTHGIYVIDIDANQNTEVIKPVIKWSGLNFKITDYVSMAYNRGVLIWTCPGSEPRYVDVQKAINTEIFKATGVAPGPILTLGANNSYSSVLFDQFKTSPIRPPEVNYKLQNATVSYPSLLSSQYGIFAFSQGAATIKTVPYISKNGSQFAYNYVYEDLSESAISPPSIIIFGCTQQAVPSNFGTVSHIIYLDEIERTYITAYRLVVKIKWYVRQGNEGDWIFFKESVITNGQTNLQVTDYLNSQGQPVTLSTFGLELPRIDNLAEIGAITPAALQPVNGIARRVVENVFADNRIIHAGLKFGVSFTPVFGRVTISQAPGLTSDVGIAQRKARTFIPVARKKSFMLIYYDDKGRTLGTRFMGTVDVPLSQKNTFRPWDNVSNGTYQDLVSVWRKGQTTLTNVDLCDRVISIITQDQLTPQSSAEYQNLVNAGVKTAKVACKDEFSIPFFYRTVTRTFIVFQDDAGKFIYGSPNIVGMTSDDWTGALRTYGIGFMFSSGDPINFSLEQNYYISVQTSTDFRDPVHGEPDWLLKQDFKVTAIDKTVLICKTGPIIDGWTIIRSRLVCMAANLISTVSNTGDDDSWLENTWESVAGGLGFNVNDDQIVVSNYRWDYSTYNIGNYAQTMADVCLYSKVEEDQQYQILPESNIDITNLQPINLQLNVKPYTFNYYGDAYVANMQMQMDVPSVSDWYVYTDGRPNGQGGITGRGLQKISNYKNGNGGFWVLNSMYGTFNYAVMSLSRENTADYSQDVGDVIIPIPNPQEENLLRTYCHGETFLEGSKLNQWFNFDPKNRRTVSGNIGNIVRVLNQSLTTNLGENIYIYGTHGVEMVFLNKVQQTGTDGSGVISLSTNIFGTSNVMRLPFGIKNPKHVVQTTQGLTFYFDSSNKVLVQVSASGQDVISEQKKFQTDMLKINNNSAMGFDPWFNEVVLIDSGYNGLAYNVLEQTYQGRRNFLNSEMFAYHSTPFKPKTLYGFYQGDVYRFDKEPTVTNGVVGQVMINDFQILGQKLTFVSNHEYNKHKVYSFIKLLSEHNSSGNLNNWFARIEGYAQPFLGIGQSLAANIDAGDFVKRHDFYQATIKTDNSNPFDGPLISGPIVTITLEGDSIYKNLIFAEVGFTLPPSQ